MNRKIIFVIVAICIFVTLFYLQGILFSGSNSKPEEKVKEETVPVLEMVRDRNKAELVEAHDYKVVEVLKSEYMRENYDSQKDIEIGEGARYRESIKAKRKVKASTISNISDDDYMVLSLNQGEVPYYYEEENNQFFNALPLKPGNLISFLSTTSTKPDTDYSNRRGELVSRVIINDAKVLKVVKDDTSEEKASYALIIALSVSDILKLEMARKLGDVQIIHSGLVSGNLTFKSRDILGTKHTIRELRGNDSQ